MNSDPNAALRDSVLQRVLDGTAESSAALRQARSKAQVSYPKAGQFLLKKGHR
ncbi:MAG TPA: hypothetical protein VGQ52_05870 [Gemmatimonadaceae bacterium]|nr:hypothetical protein [Gemmatimonadaceae bacterium]